MKIKIAWIGRTKESSIQALTDEYLKRISRYAEVEGTPLKDEEHVLALARGPRNQAKSFLTLLDSRGKQFSSEEFAQFLRKREESSSQPLLFAIGGADGFGDEIRTAAGLTLSLGKFTMPHELARVVLLEQVYRACTILAGHPYHTGH
ncbi:MAG TPA: 23S rRNA (pseudouridine(1915)-N(3))-methyltransferase RlmH [Terriglobales bacterium]|nr:23S rRNA (pseudouridine(1915)-N(3))-methyltransferase RlmH [Terriglobales bacterium]